MIKWTDDKLKGLAKDVRRYVDEQEKLFYENKTKNLPFIGRFCREKGISYVSLKNKIRNEIKREGELKTEGLIELQAAFDYFKEVQKEILIQGGLQNRFNPTFAIFTAKNITDMQDNASLELKGNREKPLYFRDIQKLDNKHLDQILIGMLAAKKSEETKNKKK